MKTRPSLTRRSVHVGFLFFGALLLGLSLHHLVGLQTGSMLPQFKPFWIQAQDMLALKIGIGLGVVFILTMNRFQLYKDGSVCKSFCLLGVLPWFIRRYEPGYFDRVELGLITTQGSAGSSDGASIHLLLAGSKGIHLNLGRYLPGDKPKKEGQRVAEALQLPFLPNPKTTTERWNEANPDYWER